MKSLVISSALLWLALSSGAQAQAPAGQFFERLKSLCGQSFVGTVVEGDAADEAFRTAKLTMTVASCSDREIRIPFQVGEDRSRTWVITRLGEDRLRLKHDHRHPDGVEDALSGYGGDTLEPGASGLQHFPVDAESRALFTRLNRSVSNTNVWSLGATPEVFTYQLARPGRLFRVAFDLKGAADHPGRQP